MFSNIHVTTTALFSGSSWLSVGFCRGSRVEGNMSRVEVEGRGRGSKSRSRVKNVFS